MKISKTAALIFYWIVALICVAAILISLEYSFAKALFLSSLFLPGAVAARVFFSQIKWDGSAKAVRDSAFLFCSIAVLEFLLIMIGHLILDNMDSQIRPYCDIAVADVLVNPVFVTAIILLLLGGEHYVRSKCKNVVEDARISFTSDRHKVTIDRNEIIYAESNDSEVWIYATEGRKFRNKTGISQWENILGDGFIRVHRSYIVNKSFVISMSMDSLTLSEGITIPISRKYRDSVKNLG